MLHFQRWKQIGIVGTVLLALLYALPNLLSAETLKSWPNFLPKRQLSLGLDLKGGSHLLLQLDTAELKKAWEEQLIDDVRVRLRRSNNIAFSNLGLSGGKVQVRIDKPEEVDKALTELRGIAQSISGVAFGGTGAMDIDVVKSGNVITLEPTPAGINQKITQGMGAAIEIIRRRVDALGTTEPNIVRQGLDRIVVQAPGIADPRILKDLIGRTAKLTFQFVHPDYSGLGAIPAEQVKSFRPPAGAVLLPDDDEAEQRKSTTGNRDWVPSRYEVIERRVIVAGEDLVDAQPGFDQRTNEPIVNFRFNQTGARRFSKATQENVGRRFAIVLDNGAKADGTRDIRVISAPVIREAITQGSGQISGRFTVESATNLAILLRSGALPATMTVVEERSVGPSLGADSIAAGKLAAIIGSIATAALTIFAYGTFGLFAVVALIINGILMIAFMSALQSTLTLPGIAGIVLTIGMAIDANVLIFERIREELRSGKPAVSAIDAGFSRAIITIADSQLTTLAAACVMFFLGSGPIRGFAVTLSIGIFTSVFTAITVTRLMIAWWLRAQREKTRNIEVPI